ncbi:D-alanyl-D-alanine carboxypeptidase family protein [Sanguibacter sp. HDW7]|uniref:M15 family metallopeptidase n=1 Tax=Sanguibacter sp. HDW7 TaxID=2714931 RepID=UPI00140CEAB8|nr:M15 family metallopeptidase [Sanguibacter sp. HDW7]QIK84017.1 hypothetical protein G7063_10600 [Sanguibacter sp. HDW7]
MSTSSKVEAPAPETRRSRREAALLDARAATAPVSSGAPTTGSATSAPVPVVRPHATAAVTSPYGTLGRPSAHVVVPDLEPDEAPVRATAQSGAASPARAAARPVAGRPHELLGRPVPATSWTPVPQPSIARGAELADAAVAARAALRSSGVTPARPSAVTDTGPVPRTVPAPVAAAARPAAAPAVRTVAPARVTPAEPVVASSAAPADVPTSVEAPTAPPAPAAAPSRQRTRRESVADERRRAGRATPRTAPRRPSGTRAARAGVLAALAIATVAVPVSQGIGQTGDEAVVRDYAEGRATYDVLMSPRGLSDNAVIVADTLAGRDVDLASRSEARPAIAGCDGTVVVPKTSNGRLSGEQLCNLPQQGHQLQPAAALAFAELNAQFVARFNTPICISDSYRSLSGQYSVAASRGAYAARPGTSQHGLGLALDLCSGTYRDSAKWSWLKANAPVYGFDNPAWARRGGSGMYEPWHWEFFSLVDY